MTTADTLTPAIDYTLRYWPGDILTPPGRHRAYSLGTLASAAGQAVSSSWTPIRQGGLVRTAAWAVWWISEILDCSIRDVWAMVRAEYDHSRYLPRHRPDMSDGDRADWLIVLVGVVADTPGDATEDLADALLQAATMATAWLARILTDTEHADGHVDVVDDQATEPAPEAEPGPEAEAWPTEPIIRVLDGHQGHRDLGGAIALRVGLSAYRLYDGGDEVGLVLRDQPDAGIEEWEALSVVPTEAIRTLTSRLSALGIASPLSHDAALARVVDVAEDLIQVADTAEAVD